MFSSHLKYHFNDIPSIFPIDPFYIKTKQIDFVLNLCFINRYPCGTFKKYTSLNDHSMTLAGSEKEMMILIYWRRCDESFSFFFPHTMLKYWLEHNLMKKFFTLVHTHIHFSQTYRDKQEKVETYQILSSFFFTHSFFYSSQAAINQNGNNMSNFLFYFLVLVFAFFFFLLYFIFLIDIYQFPTSSS